MEKRVYIDGNFLVKNGVFFGLNFCMFADESIKSIADKIISCDKSGVYEVTKDGGSMFTEYYVKGGITMYGENGSSIIYFKEEHEQTYIKYKHIQEQIILLLESSIIQDKCKNYFYQQQYISLIANLEYFLYNTFMWETCQCYESYKRVLPLLAKYIDKKKKRKTYKILRGKHNLLQEKTFIEQVNHIVYHNYSKVKEIYKAAFNINVDLNEIKDELNIRHDIVHRAGYTKGREQINISKEQVILLKDKIDTLVEKITREIALFKESNVIPS